MNDVNTKFFHVKRLVRKLMKKSGLQIYTTTNLWVTILLKMFQGKIRHQEEENFAHFTELICGSECQKVLQKRRIQHFFYCIMLNIWCE